MFLDLLGELLEREGRREGGRDERRDQVGKE